MKLFRILKKAKFLKIKIIPDKLFGLLLYLKGKYVSVTYNFELLNRKSYFFRDFSTTHKKIIKKFIKFLEDIFQKIFNTDLNFPKSGRLERTKILKIVILLKEHLRKLKKNRRSWTRTI